MRWPVFLLLAALAGCGTLPQPFYGNPGGEATRLSIPPPPILIVTPPSRALLPGDAAKTYADDLAAALVAVDVPSLARPADTKDWRLITTASQHGQEILPAYTVLGPDGHIYGGLTGSPVSAAAWLQGDPTTLNKTAGTDALALARLLADINAKVQQSNPQSLENRAARVFIAKVTGAPTDGDTALALGMARDLPGADTIVVTREAQADFTISGAVNAQAEGNNQMLVQIVWTVRDAGNRTVGQVTQLHALDLVDITPYWGDVAAAAAKEGATGVQEVITNATLHKAGHPAS